MGSRTATGLLIAMIVAAALWYQRPTPGPASGALYPAELPSGRVGEPCEIFFEVAGSITPGSSFTLLAGALPAGLHLLPNPNAEAPGTAEANRPRITGTPTEAGTFTFRLRATTFGTQRPGLSAERDYEWLIRAAE
jgi:hypothetical protein